MGEKNISWDMQKTCAGQSGWSGHLVGKHKNCRGNQITCVLWLMSSLVDVLTSMFFVVFFFSVRTHRPEIMLETTSGRMTSFSIRIRISPGKARYCFPGLDRLADSLTTTPKQRPGKEREDQSGATFLLILLGDGNKDSSGMDKPIPPPVHDLLLQDRNPA